MPRLVSALIAVVIGSCFLELAVAGELEARTELAPSGILRIGVLTGPASSALTALLGEDGRCRGVPVDLGNELAKRLEVRAEFAQHQDLPALTKAALGGAVDVSIMPIDSSIGDKLEFAPPYYLDADAFLVLDEDLRSTSDLKRRRYVRIVGLIDSDALRRAEQSLRDNSAFAVSTPAEAIGLLIGGTAHAFVSSRDALRPYLRELPGSRLLDGGAQATGISFAVAKNKREGLAFVRDVIEDAKRSGLLRTAFERAGLKLEAIAPGQQKPN